MSISKISPIQKIQSIQQKIKLLQNYDDWQSVLIPWLRTELTYTSNSLEGNTLSLIETSIIINDNQSVAGKNLREIYEATNHAAAFDLVQKDLLNKKTEDLNEKDLLSIHALILKNIDEENNKIGEDNIPNPFLKPKKFWKFANKSSWQDLDNILDTELLIAEMFLWLKNQPLESLQEILETAILTHLKIVKIHPFTDGNGRTARLFMNAILMQNQLPPMDILPTKRKEYLESLEEATEMKTAKFTNFCLSQYDENLDVYLETFQD